MAKYWVVSTYHIVSILQLSGGGGQGGLGECSRQKSGRGCHWVKVYPQEREVSIIPGSQLRCIGSVEPSQGLTAVSAPRALGSFICLSYWIVF